jgi:hypothetical protein
LPPKPPLKINKRLKRLRKRNPKPKKKIWIWEDFSIDK